MELHVLLRYYVKNSNMAAFNYPQCSALRPVGHLFSVRYLTIPLFSKSRKSMTKLSKQCARLTKLSNQK
jgi:hypothetical protein